MRLFLKKDKKISFPSSFTQVEQKDHVTYKIESNNHRNIIEKYEDVDFVADKLLFTDQNEKDHLTEAELKNILFIKTDGSSKGGVYLAVLHVVDVPQTQIKDIILKYSKIAEHKYNLTTSKTYRAKAGVISTFLQKIRKDDQNQLREVYVRDFDKILQVAIKNHATDIHFTVRGTYAKIQFRVHGDLITYDTYEVNYIHHMIRAIYNGKGIEGQKDTQFSGSEMQQTIIERTINQKKYRLRFASAAIEANDLMNDDLERQEAYIVALRILSTDKSDIKPLTHLGYSTRQIELIEEAMRFPSGGIIIAGTTGSGKSTTLAGMLTRLIEWYGDTRKYISIESPVEYLIELVNQLIVHESANMTEEEISKVYDITVKTTMRLDPDIIYCNEIRSENTAKSAQKSIQSGHPFYTTVHAQNALAIVERLCGIGMEREVVCSPDFLLLLVYQTLVQTLCHDCSLSIEEYDATNSSRKSVIKSIYACIEKYNLDESLIKNIRFKNKKGCSNCNHLGVKGRTVVAEVVSPTSSMLVHIRNKEHELAYKVWREKGGMTIKEHGLVKVLEGMVCPEALESKVGPLHIEKTEDLFDKNFYKNIIKF
ncbi:MULTISPECIES: GspE/PulE family protein [Cysteiniphilum]|uniref:Toxin coregulated pilus biosynthesis protein T n=1 Tax=Cysteiniphilum litorale TaxID=2056700 RepID=A0A8J2Z3A7_9GAMM|nr:MULTISPECIES: ATPase, T2SS/T4P/T4SS family [Cysteiniphilum]GGF91998.1 toxin coregulated pilus biosynthesis protein T [Cysteiniphilum litorale]